MKKTGSSVKWWSSLKAMKNMLLNNAPMPSLAGIAVYAETKLGSNGKPDTNVD